jgi:hypothetical protein
VALIQEGGFFLAADIALCQEDKEKEKDKENSLAILKEQLNA